MTQTQAKSSKGFCTGVAILVERNEEGFSPEGLSWLDREWSTSVLGDHLQGWDWFALQLDDGRSLMVFQLRRKDGGRDPYDHGMLISTEAARPLAPQDYTLKPLRFWQDSEGVAWPVEWQLELPALDANIVTLRALRELPLRFRSGG